MKRFSSQFVITNAGPVLRRAVITVDDEGTIISVDDTGGDLREEPSVEFHNGIIIPGFVNCHCHLELSHMKGSLPPGSGLGNFIEHVRSARSTSHEDIATAAFSSDKLMHKSGISLCADICNSTDTFGIKKESRIKYINLLEVFGIDPARACKRMEEMALLAKAAEQEDLEYYITPHSAYSVSLTLFSLLKSVTGNNKVTSIHFMETPAEKELLASHSGALMDTYRRSGLLRSEPQLAFGHSSVIVNEITASGNLILVHNTFADQDTIAEVNSRKNLFWCLCPNSNLHIENTLPPVRLLKENGCRIVVGTDSLASNSRLSILEELKTLQLNFADLTLAELIRWGTLNGAIALGEEEKFGSIKPGKKPGLALIEDADLSEMKLTAESTVTRLI